MRRLEKQRVNVPAARYTCLWRSSNAAEIVSMIGFRNEPRRQSPNKVSRVSTMLITISSFTRRTTFALHCMYRTMWLAAAKLDMLAV